MGLAQLLELYTVASIQSQHSKRFPTQTWSTISEMREKVRALGSKWEWGEEPLQYAGIEAPAKVKERLERNHEEGAAVDTFRKSGKERAHLPTRLWGAV